MTEECKKAVNSKLEEVVRVLKKRDTDGRRLTLDKSIKSIKALNGQKGK